MATETVVVKDTTDANERGWYTVVLEDGREATTKDRKIVDAAFHNRGNPVEADINEVVNGNFTNTYLNAIAGVGEVRERSNGAGSGSPRTRGRRSATPAGGGVTDEKGERIARQWAYGRATELLASIGGVQGVDEHGLADEDKKFLESAATWLLEKTS